MKSNVVDLRPPTAVAAVEQAEPVEAAVREVSSRIAENNAARRLLFYRLDELRGLSPERRRRRARPLPPSMSQSVTFFSIEEADSEAPAPRRVARGGR